MAGQLLVSAQAVLLAVSDAGEKSVSLAGLEPTELVLVLSLALSGFGTTVQTD